MIAKLYHPGYFKAFEGEVSSRCDIGSHANLFEFIEHFSIEDTLETMTLSSSSSFGNLHHSTSIILIPLYYRSVS